MSESVHASIHEEVTTLCQELVRSLKSVALYRHDPRRYPEFLSPFYRGLHRLLAHHAPLELSVSADALLFHDQRVFEDDTGEFRLCFRYYNEGIRKIIFHEGVQLDELTEFIELSLPKLNTLSIDLPPGHLITSLWKAGLTCITYEQAQQLKLMPEDRSADVLGSIKQIARDVTQMLADEKTQVENFDLGVSMPEIPKEESSAFAPLRTKAKKPPSFQGLLDHPADPQKVLDRFAQFLLHVLSKDRRGQDNEVITRAFICLLHEAFRRGLVGIIPKIVARLDAEPGDGETRQDRIRRVYVLNAVRAAMNDEDYIQVLSPLQSEASGLQNLCHIVGTEAFPAYIEAMERADGGEAIRSMAAGFGNRLNVNPEAVETLFSLPSVASILPAFAEGLEDFRPSESIRAILERNLNHHEPGVRSGVTHMLATVFTITNLKDAARGLQSIDPIERVACVKSLARSRDNGAAETLVSWLEGLDITKLPRDEIMEAYKALGSMHSIHGLEFLKKRLTDKTMLGAWKHTPQEQALAVHGLANAGDSIAKRVLVQAAQHKNLSGPVKMALRAALTAKNP